MKTKITTLALGLLISPIALAGMDCSDPMHAQMDACKAQAAMPNKAGEMDHSKMDHSKHAMPMTKPAMEMDHSKMDHSKWLCLQRNHPCHRVWIAQTQCMLR